MLNISSKPTQNVTILIHNRLKALGVICLCVGSLLILFGQGTGRASAWWLVLFGIISCTIVAVLLSQCCCCICCFWGSPVLNTVQEETPGDNNIKAENSHTFNRELTILVWLGLIIITTFIGMIGSWVVAGAIWSPYVVDQVFAGLLAAACMAIPVFAVLKRDQLVLPKQRPRRFPSSIYAQKAYNGCRECCFWTQLVAVLFIAFITAWNACVLGGGLLHLNEPGLMFETTDPATNSHVYCIEGDGDESKPTVLFLHGYLGSSLDASWVSQNQQFIDTGQHPLKRQLSIRIILIIIYNNSDQFIHS